MYTGFFVLVVLAAWTAYVTDVPPQYTFSGLLLALLCLVIRPLRRLLSPKAAPIFGIVGGWLVACLIARDLLPETWPLAPHIFSGVAVLAGLGVRAAYARGMTGFAERPALVAGGLFALGLGVYLAKLIMELPTETARPWWSMVAFIAAAIIGGLALAALAGWQAVAAWNLLGPLPRDALARPDAKLADPEELRRAGVSRDL